MSKLLLSVLLEVIVGISLAGLLLAIIVPAINRYRTADIGDSPGAMFVGAVIVGVAAVVLFRPGSAINRWRRRSTM